MKSYEFHKYIKPIWSTEEIVDETFMFLGEEDVAPFLYKPNKILSVTPFSSTNEYVNGKDYNIKNGCLCRIKGGNTPFYPIDEYYVSDPGKYGINVAKERVPFKLEGDKYLVYGEGDSFTKYQVSVSYLTGEKWKGKIPEGKEKRFPNFHKKLCCGEDVNVTFYGDSITTGCNASGMQQGGEVPPFLPSFDMLIKRYLEEKYSSTINVTNTAVGGWDTSQGLSEFEERVIKTNPDLLVLAFGMNDLLTPLDKYHAMIEEMVCRLHSVNPNAEVVLVATMLPNIESTWLLNQQYTLQELEKIEKEYSFTAVADVTTIHGEILSFGKRYRDMTGNNINHPNDFVVRIYAQVILKTLLGDAFK